MPTFTPLTPTYTAELLAPLHDELVGLLRGLGPSHWELPTVAGSWRVRDVVAHLLGGDLGRLSAYRDGYTPVREGPVESYDDLLALINEQNAAWVLACRRFSSRVLLELIEETGARAAALMMALPPHERAIWAVAWAGERESEQWLDTGREYTERWHHQMQIRDAVSSATGDRALYAALLEPHWLVPLLDLSVRALPRAYAEHKAPHDTTLSLIVADDAAYTIGSWSLRRDASAWRLFQGATPDATTTVRLTADDAWRLFYNALPSEKARSRAIITGDQELAAPLFSVRSVMV
jgi:hypothetical protein